MMTRRREKPIPFLAALACLAGLTAVALAAGLAGCGGGIPEGCALDDAVPARVRADVEAAAARFFEQARRGEAQAIYEEAAPSVRAKSTPEQFLTPIAQAARVTGIPALTTRSIAVIRYGEGMPYQARLVCGGEDEESGTLFLLPDYPTQASLVQTGESGGETIYFSTVWFLEDKTWRLAMFFAKPATVFGKDSGQYAAEAAQQRAEGNSRNAALLYNLAIDLAVPAAWIKPPAVDELQRAQKRISVSRMPSDRLDPWPAPPDTFRVYSVGYGIFGDVLGVTVRYETEGAVSDTLAQRAYGERMMRYVRREFPEFPAVFHRALLEGHERGDRTKIWQGVFPLEGER